LAEIYETAASLSFTGDDLDPEEISSLLGKPTRAAKKGGVLISAKGYERVSYTGIWLIESPDAQPGNVDQQILTLLSGFSEDYQLWNYLSDRYNGKIFVGLFLHRNNEGLCISPQTLFKIGIRGLKLDLDVYCNNDKK
jgi:Domain of unknown function (DUF4279)